MSRPNNGRSAVDNPYDVDLEVGLTEDERLIIRATPFSGMLVLLVAFTLLGVLGSLGGHAIKGSMDKSGHARTAELQIQKIQADLSFSTPQQAFHLHGRWQALVRWVGNADMRDGDRKDLRQSLRVLGGVVGARFAHHLSQPELLSPQEYASMALQLHRLRNDPAAEMAGALDEEEADRLLQQAIDRGTQTVLELGRADAGLDELVAAESLVRKLGQLVDPLLEPEYRAAAEMLSGRVADLVAQINAAEQGAPPQGRDSAEDERHQFAAATFASLQENGIPVEVLQAGGEGARDLEIEGALPIDELTIMFLGSDALRTKLLSLGFARVVARGEGGESILDIGTRTQIRSQGSGRSLDSNALRNLGL